MKKSLLFLLMAILVSGFLVACTAKQPVAQPPAAQPPTAQPPATITEPPAAAQGPVKEFTMTANAFTFDPATITVNQGDHVIIHAKSLDVEHGISIPDFGVNVNL